MSASGNWRLKIDSPITKKPFNLRLDESAGGALTGTILEEGSTGPAQAISNGRVNGTSVSWSTSKPVPVTYAGTLNGNSITGDVKGPGFTAKFAATR